MGNFRVVALRGLRDIVPAPARSTDDVQRADNRTLSVVPTRQPPVDERTWTVTPSDLATEALRLAESIEQALKARYGAAVAYRDANHGKPLPGHVYAALCDLDGHVREMQRAATLTERGKVRLLRAVLGKVTT
jgi:hypothetical protein